tara:strand:- start:548 stop:691 length:144 start_codon:yes stop_codon:yes gene_type:complete
MRNRTSEIISGSGAAKAVPEEAFGFEVPTSNQFIGDLKSIRDLNICI